MSRKYFGTDGIRGKVGETPITPEFFLQLGWALGEVLAKSSTDGKNLILIGKDTRISGYMFESALESGLIAAGVDVGLLGPMPTPAIAYLTRTFRAKAGLVISASHNPYFDNGLKIFNSQGMKLDDAIESSIERYLDKPLVTEDRLGKASRIEDAAGRYVEFCKASVPRGFSLQGMNIVLDCANGATYQVAPKVFNELGASVTCISASPDGLNINEECGSTHTKRLVETVKDLDADLGIAFDGDGDRVLFVDSQGELVDGDQLLFIIARATADSDLGCKGVVGTQMSNLGLQLGLEALGVPFVRAKVGDRYVLEAMNDKGWTLGGESSGHILCNDVTSTGDGIISALQVLLALQKKGESLREACGAMNKMPQTMINVPLKKRGFDISNFPSVGSSVKDAESSLGKSGRVLLRASGTEPLVRVMVEGESKPQIDTLAEQIADAVRHSVN